MITQCADRELNSKVILTFFLEEMGTEQKYSTPLEQWKYNTIAAFLVAPTRGSLLPLWSIGLNFLSFLI
jgi:hypothetical protein